MTTPAQYNWITCDFNLSLLPASPRRSTYPRRQKVQFVVVHHTAMVGKTESALQSVKNAWKTREASAHYGVVRGFVWQYVYDNREAWATANSLGNQAGISIEHVNETGADGWTVHEETWKTGAKLVAALHLFHNLGRPVADKTLFGHRDFFRTACPGPFLWKILAAAYVKEAQKQYDLLSKGSTPKPDPVTPALKPIQLNDNRISELSGTVLSVANPGCFWAINDEPGYIWLVRIADGAIVGSFKIEGVTLKDEEAIAYDFKAKKLVILDAGDINGKRTKGATYSLPEPKGLEHHGALPAVRASFDMAKGQNFEAFFIDPKTGQQYLVNKSICGELYKRNGSKLSQVPDVKFPPFTTDATLSPTGSHVLSVAKDVDQVTAHEFGTWKDKGHIPHPAQPQPESIFLYPNGSHVMVGSEGVKSKLQPVKIPAEWI